MIHCTISYEKPHQHWLNIELTFSALAEDQTYLQLPAWRPGRYELGNFAKNIQKFSITDTSDVSLPFRKVTKDRWEVDTKDVDRIRVRYTYYAAELNAGSTYLDEEQLYINFVNCMLYAEGQTEAPYHIHLQLPEDYQVACGLQQPELHTLEAPSFYHLAESPLIASPTLTHWEYEVGEHRFHLWFQGTCVLNEEQTLNKFRAFTETQMQMMGDFPADDYHFLYHFLPYRAYHGVEHFNSTVIALGPSEQIAENSKPYLDFLGVSSHELFHTWNIIRIRPKEMFPYDYTRENYFPTGFIAEGVTTYYGDLFLVRSGVITREEYFLELNKLFKRHFENFGRFNHSLVDSSFDLWLDGYSLGIPHRKVSIYVKGALVSLILDLTLRGCTGQEQSLDSFMRYLWDFFGKQKAGYSLADLEKLVSDLSGGQIDTYFERFIYGKEPLEIGLNQLLYAVGCRMDITENAFHSEGKFGFRAINADQKWVIQGIEPNSVADDQLALNDEIIAINGIHIQDSLEELLAGQDEVSISLLRNQKLKTISLTRDDGEYYKVYTIAQRDDATETEKQAFQQWLGCAWE
ncbi:MAG: M61 family peptidase [Cyclobacteriaceae bacterium]